MRSHQRLVLSALYRATEPDGGRLLLDYKDWLHDVVRVRGELDRKKKVPPGDIAVLLDASIASPDLSRFVYAAERYILARAIRIITECSPTSLAAGDSLSSTLRRALAAARAVDEVLAVEAPEALAIERREANDLVHQSSGPLTDVFQAEFAQLIPRQVRHAIGSFYTPQWLARHVLRSSGYRWEQASSLRMSVCDPACGSGVFLVAAAEEIRQATEAGSVTIQDALGMLETNLRGIDIELVPCILATASLTLACFRVATMAEVPTEVKIPTTIEHADSLSPLGSSVPVDLVIGNPPWVNWEYMPAEYREKHRDLWPELGIFRSAGKAMGFSKEDISALFVAHAVHERLKPGGAFAFVLPESLIKSSMNHRDFRRFELGPASIPFRVSAADDFVEAKPFEGVANRTIVLYGSKGSVTTYPISFRAWGKLKGSQQPITGSGALKAAVVESAAQLADVEDRSSSWSTGHVDGLAAHRMLDGKNPYRGRTGLFTGGANAVYHLKVLDADGSGRLTVQNVVERAKRAAPQVVATLEDAYLYPFLRGRDVRQWHSEAELLVLLPHTAATRMEPVSPEVLESDAPRTLQYLDQFREVLGARKGFSAWEQQFLTTGYYACQRVGDYTFAEWKVVWRYISPRFTTAVIGPGRLPGSSLTKPVIPNEKLMLIACASPDEAYYVGGVLAGSVVVEHVHSRMVSTQVSPSVVASIGIPPWDAADPMHLAISELCRLGHDAVSRGRSVDSIVDELDVLVATLWAIDEGRAHDSRARIGY